MDFRKIHHHHSLRQNLHQMAHQTDHRKGCQTDVFFSIEPRLKTRQVITEILLYLDYGTFSLRNDGVTRYVVHKNR